MARRYVVGVTIAEMGSAEPLPGSRLCPCMRCEEIMWLTPQSMVLVFRRRGTRAVCSKCAVEIVEARVDKGAKA